MTQHPEEGTLHAYIDGELSPAEAATLELHVGECARCAAALAEARGFAAAASRVITTLDAAPSSAAAPAAPAVVKPSAPSRRAVRPPAFRVPYARAAALLLLVGGTAIVVDRTGTFARGENQQAESLLADVATASDAGPAAATVTAPASPPEAEAARDLAIGAGVGSTGNAARDVVVPPRVAARGATDATRRTRTVERSAPPVEPVPSTFQEQRGVAGGTATGARPAAPVAKLAAKETPTAEQAMMLPAAPPARPALRLEGVVVTGAQAFGPTVSHYRTKDGTVVTLTEEPLRTSFVEESTAVLQNASPELQRRAAAAMAAPAINSYRWSSAEHGKTYTISGPLTVAELEALSKRLSELERLP